MLNWKMTAYFVILGSVLAFGNPENTGFSGAPGSDGTCAFSCHGGTGGTITVTGFPGSYIPGQAYSIKVSHNGGWSLKGFNSSVRVGTGSVNAGTLTAGTNTATYNVNGETNGIHLNGSSLDSCRFNWTAPEKGTGTVKLYLAGLQGNREGPNSEIAIQATEQTGVVVTSERRNVGNGIMMRTRGKTIALMNLPVERATVFMYRMEGSLLNSTEVLATNVGAETIVLEKPTQPGTYIVSVRQGNTKVFSRSFVYAR